MKVMWCPYCASRAMRRISGGMMDCINPSCRVRFLVNYARKKRKAPSKRRSR